MWRGRFGGEGAGLAVSLKSTFVTEVDRDGHLDLVLSLSSGASGAVTLMGVSSFSGDVLL